MILTAPTGSPPYRLRGIPEGSDQIVIYSRSDDDDLSDVGLHVTSEDETGAWAGSAYGVRGSSGCQAVDYPWPLSVGPPETDRAHHEQVLTSGDMSGGTVAIWADVGSDEVTIDWGRPDWARVDVPANCGAAP
jgi:hypothetical protein